MWRLVVTIKKNDPHACITKNPKLQELWRVSESKGCLHNFKCLKLSKGCIDAKFDIFNFLSVHLMSF